MILLKWKDDIPYCQNRRGHENKSLGPTALVISFPDPPSPDNRECTMNVVRAFADVVATNCEMAIQFLINRNRNYGIDRNSGSKSGSSRTLC